jgi:hypothetical protein
VWARQVLPQGVCGDVVANYSQLFGRVNGLNRESSDLLVQLIAQAAYCAPNCGELTGEKDLCE